MALKRNWLEQQGTARKLLQAKSFNEKFNEKKKKLKYNKTDDTHPNSIQAPHGIYAMVSNTVSTSHYTY